MDDSYELLRQRIFGGRIGLVIGVEALGREGVDVYGEGALASIEAFTRSETLKDLEEAPDFNVSIHAMGRSSAGLAGLLALGGGLLWLVSRAKNIDDGLKTIKKWSVQLQAWRVRFELMGQHPSFTVETLKILCAADLYDRFGIDTDPCIGLIRTQASGAQAADGSWHSFGPVWVFIPDNRKKLTHLYAINYTGTILHRGEVPAFELEGISDERLGTMAPLQLPIESVDPARERFFAEMEKFNPSTAETDERTFKPCEPTKEE